MLPKYRVIYRKNSQKLQEKVWEWHICLKYKCRSKDLLKSHYLQSPKVGQSSFSNPITKSKQIKESKGPASKVKILHLSFQLPFIYLLSSQQMTYGKQKKKTFLLFEGKNFFYFIGNISLFVLTKKYITYS